MSRVTAVLFDLDGVLVDSYLAWRALLGDAVAHFGGRPFDDDQFRAGWGQSSAEDCALYLPGILAPELDRFYAERFVTRAIEVRLLPGALDALLACRARGLPAGVVTNAPVAVARAILEGTGLQAGIATLVGADQVARPKPAPDPVHEAARRLGVASSETALVGDSRFDVEAARGAGARTIAVTRGLGADHEIDSLLELPPLLNLLLATAVAEERC